MLFNLDSFLSNPVQTLIIFLLAFPGRILALSAHEFAHAWVAHRCGDDTARMMGRLTLNPLKHLDPLGTVMMLLVGFGWAKPVPVNPRNYRDYRRDDLKVSLAGVTMNLILFAVGLLSLASWCAIGIAGAGESWLGASIDGLVREYGFLSGALTLLAYRFGEIPGYLAQMLAYFTVTNLALCVFNLLPVPPLDGYHVINDLLLKRSLFANPNTARIASTVLMVLVFTGAVGRVLGWVDDQVITAAGNLAMAGIRALGLAG